MCSCVDRPGSWEYVTGGTASWCEFGCWDGSSRTEHLVTQYGNTCRNRDTGEQWIFICEERHHGTMCC